MTTFLDIQLTKKDENWMESANLVTSLTFIRVIVFQAKNQQEIPALLDCGSQINLVHKKWVKNRSQLTYAPITLKSATGHSLNSLGGIELIVKIGQLIMKLPFLVVDNIPHDMLI